MKEFLEKDKIVGKITRILCEEFVIQFKKKLLQRFTYIFREESNNFFSLLSKNYKEIIEYVMNQSHIDSEIYVDYIYDHQVNLLTELIKREIEKDSQ